jgi:hypothetical protein
MGTPSTTAPEGATTLSTKPDAAILAAWDRRAAAFEALRRLPIDAATGGSTPEQDEHWAIADAAEAEICAAVATTPRGAELQLWVAATYVFDTAEDEAPCYRADLDWLNTKFAGLDWTHKLMVATIRSLRAMGGEA